MAALSNRDANIPLAASPEKTSAAGGENKMQGAMYHKPMLGGKFAGKTSGKQTGTYVSPSDAIQSPATQKLAGFKQRQINKTAAKNSAARSLFARTTSTCSSTSGLEDSEDVAGSK